MTRLSDEQLEHFQKEGYVVVEDVIEPEDVLDPLEAEYGTVLDGLASRLQEEGAIGSTYVGMGFGRASDQNLPGEWQGALSILRLFASAEEHHV